MLVGAVVCNIIGSVLFFCVVALRASTRRAASRGVAPETFPRARDRDVVLQAMTYGFLVASAGLYLGAVVRI